MPSPSSLSHDRKEENIIATLMERLALSTQPTQKIIDISKAPRLSTKPIWSDIIAWAHAFKDFSHSH
jgi:hypothetical protein